LKRRKFVLALVMPMVVGVATGISAPGVECPIHGNSGAYFTGKTKTVDGVLLHEYKCSRDRGHTFWVAQRAPEKKPSGVQCPIHGSSGAYFTGKTKTVDGVLLYEYKCSRNGGHTFWARP
jgi:hypothetical protein